MIKNAPLSGRNTHLDSGGRGEVVEGQRKEMLGEEKTETVERIKIHKQTIPSIS